MALSSYNWKLADYLMHHWTDLGLPEAGIRWLDLVMKYDVWDRDCWRDFLLSWVAKATTRPIERSVVNLTLQFFVRLEDHDAVYDLVRFPALNLANFERRCLALEWAARAGHLDIVSSLAELKTAQALEERAMAAALVAAVSTNQTFVVDYLLGWWANQHNRALFLGEALDCARHQHIDEPQLIELLIRRLSALDCLMGLSFVTREKQKIFNLLIDNNPDLLKIILEKIQHLPNWPKEQVLSQSIASPNCNEPSEPSVNAPTVTGSSAVSLYGLFMTEPPNAILQDYSSAEEQASSEADESEQYSVFH